MELDEVLEQVGRPVYGVAGWVGSRQISGWGGGNGSFDLHLRHSDAAFKNDGPRVEVETCSNTSIPFRRRWMLQRWLGSGLDLDEEPTFPLTITVESWEADLIVDDVAQTFTFVGRPTRWIAEADLDGRRVSVNANHIEASDVALVSIDDVESLYERPTRG